MYFKGQWKNPFNKTATRRAPFFAEDRKTLGEVQLMFQARPFPYDRNDRIKAHILELPYGFVSHVTKKKNKCKLTQISG